MRFCDCRVFFFFFFVSTGFGGVLWPGLDHCCASFTRHCQTTGAFVPSYSKLVCLWFEVFVSQQELMALGPHLLLASEMLVAGTGGCQQ